MAMLDAGWLWFRLDASKAMALAVQHSPLKLRVLPAIAVYVVMALGLWWFAVRRATGWKSAARNGAALGAVVYGVYDLTNYSILRNYPLSYAAADWAWGTVLFAATAGISYHF